MKALVEAHFWVHAKITMIMSAMEHHMIEHESGGKTDENKEIFSSLFKPN